MVSKSERESPWYEYGTDAQFQDWCRQQPCAVIGSDIDVIYAHYRTAKNSGIATKPPYSGVPMNYLQHLEQHRLGQYAFKPREWWESQVLAHLIRWAKTRGMK